MDTLTPRQRYESTLLLKPVETGKVYLPNFDLLSKAEIDSLLRPFSKEFKQKVLAHEHKRKELELAQIIPQSGNFSSFTIYSTKRQTAKKESTIINTFEAVRKTEASLNHNIAES